MPLAPLVPDRFESALGLSTETLSFDGSRTNLTLITEFHLKSPYGHPPRRIRIRDDHGNIYDTDAEPHTLIKNDVVVTGWEITAFPRGGKILEVKLITPIWRGFQKRAYDFAWREVDLSALYFLS